MQEKTSRKLILASNNAGKAREFKRMLEPIGIELLTLKEAGVSMTAEETGTTFAENARIKAMSIYEKTHLATVADDSGICIDFYEGGPGVYSARYLGEDTSYDIKNGHILDEMKDAEDSKRGARYVCHITCVLSEDNIIDCEGVCEGKIGRTPAGNGGFGYDPIFYVGDKSFGELSDAEKDKQSHRGKALRKLYLALKEQDNK